MDSAGLEDDGRGRLGGDAADGYRGYPVMERLQKGVERDGDELGVLRDDWSLLL